MHHSKIYGQHLCLTCLIFVLAGCAAQKSTQTANWEYLFDGKTAAGWRSFKKPDFPAKGWVIENCWLHCLGQKGGDIITEKEFGDFELEWEWKIFPAGNSGVKYFVTEARKSAIGHEYQMIDDDREPDAKIAEGKHVTGSFYDVLKPSLKPPVLPVGQINRSRIVVRGNHIEHWLNGKKVLEYECGSEAIKRAVAESKFNTVEGFGKKIRGHILLQDHHTEAWFRNIRIRQ